MHLSSKISEQLNDLSGTQLKVWIYILVNDPNKGIPSISKAIGISENSVRMSIKVLSKKGFITVNEQVTPHEYRGNSEYVVYDTTSKIEEPLKDALDLVNKMREIRDAGPDGKDGAIILRTKN